MRILRLGQNVQVPTTFRTSMAQAGICLSPWLLLLLVLQLISPASTGEFAQSDPLVRALGIPLATWTTVVLGGISAAYWIVSARPSSNVVVHGVLWGALGAVFAAIVLLALYWVVGPAIPGFIPPEESSASGLLLGLTAGTLEEILFRMVLAPTIFMALASRKRLFVAIAISAVVVGLAFALSHEVAGDPFNIRYFLTRFLIPGVGMSMVYFVIHPATMVCGHIAAHVFIAWLFVV